VNDPDLAGRLGEHAARHSVPGAAVGILEDGVRTTAYHGVADVSTGDPVTAETRFAVGSLTKSMTATAVALLADAGLLSLDDPAPVHVPELRGAAWGERATIRDLLANRSRVPLRDELEFSTFPGEDDGVLSRFAAEIGKGEATPEVWSYANVGWALLGRALETVTGGSWEDAVRATVVEPLGLDGTAFASSPVAEPRAAGHAIRADGPAPVERPWTPRSLAPAGTTLLSTLTDMLRFAAAHLDEPALAGLRVRHANVRIHAWLDGWCLGWAQFDWEGGGVWGWDGLISGQRAILRLVPERRGALVLLTNCDTGRAVYRSLVPVLMEERFGIRVPPFRLEPVPGAAGDLERFAGAYAWPDRLCEVTARGDGLVLSADGRTREAVPLEDGVFLVDAADPDAPTVTFGAFDEEGRPGAVYLMIWGLPRVASAGSARAAA
jgi:CubicO group peptidase (beta-lactamase class C family)